jgi:hypothetical protein
MVDETEDIRRFMVGAINSVLSEYEDERLKELVESWGIDNVWDTEGVQRDFEITSFFAPYCFARRKSDNVKGTLQFSHSPRFYFDFTPS